MQHQALKRLNLSMVHPCVSEDCLTRAAKTLGIKVLTGAVLVNALEAASCRWSQVGTYVRLVRWVRMCAYDTAALEDESRT